MCVCVDTYSKENKRVCFPPVLLSVYQRSKFPSVNRCQKEIGERR